MLLCYPPATATPTTCMITMGFATPECIHHGLHPHEHSQKNLNGFIASDAPIQHFQTFRSFSECITYIYLQLMTHGPIQRIVPCLQAGECPVCVSINCDPVSKLIMVLF